MKILLSHVKESSRDFQLEAPMTLLGMEERAEAGRVRAELRVDPAGERWTVSGKVEGRFPFICDFCGTRYSDTIGGEFSLQVLSRSIRGMKEEEDEDLLFLPGGSREIDLSDKVQEILQLNLPIQLRCREECAGLCVKCGADLNLGECECEDAVDSRWSALQDLKKMMDSEGEPSDKSED